jgi:nucleoside-diphosphate-sugar epimerase
MARAAAGCEAVVHAAAVYSWDPRKADEMERTNAAATAAVLGGGLDAGVARIIHVSSTVALSRRAGGVVDRSAPPGDLGGSYIRSKVDSDRAVRAWQAEGAPIVRVHPCAQYGPHDPYLNPSNVLIRDILRGWYPMWPTGSLPWGDVRDTAATIAAVVDGRGDGGAAWLTPCHNLADDQMKQALREVTGRRLPGVVLPGRALGAVLGAARPLVKALPDGIQPPMPQEKSTELAAAGTVFDDSATVELLGVPRRPLPDALADTVRWMVAAGHLTAKQAGHAG